MVDRQFAATQQNGQPGGYLKISLTSLDFTLARGKIRSQREPLKSVPGSNEGVAALDANLPRIVKCQDVSTVDSGNATWVAPAAQHAASRTGENEYRW
jgi:hypothetical protein